MLKLKKSHMIAFAITVLAGLWILSGIWFPSGQTSAGISESSAQKTQSDQDHANHDKTASRSASLTSNTQVRVRDIEAENHIYDVVITGRTLAGKRIDLRAEAQGQISRISFDRGQMVKAGDILAEIAVEDRSARSIEARQLVKQRQSEYDAAKTLAEQGFASRIRLQEAGAQLEAAKARLKETSISLEKTKITAPFDAQIQERNIEKGDFVSSGQAAFTLVNLDTVKFTGFLSERQIQDIKSQETGRIELLDNSTLEADILYISPAADPQTRTYRIELEAPNPNQAIKEGFTATIRLPTAGRKAHKISPAVLSLNEDGRVGVKIVDDNNKVIFKPVTILSDQSDHMWIGGLPDAVRLITVGQEFVQSGQMVTPVPATGEGLL